MQIVEIQHIEDCLDGSFIREIYFSAPLTKQIILYLGAQTGAKLSYYPDFARPFFKLLYNGGSYLKGVEGNPSARAVWWQIENDEKTLRLWLANMPEKEA